MSAVQCSKTKKVIFFQKKHVVMNLDFVSSSGNPPSHVTTLFKAIEKTMAETEFQIKARKQF